VTSPWVREYLEVLAVDPRSVSAFLRVTGWEMTRETSGVSSVWAMPNAAASVMLPLDDSFRDYNERLVDAMRVISEVHGVSGQALALEIASATSDVMLLRADQSTFDGSIPIREAEALLGSARKMITAAALSTVSPRASYGTARPAAVSNFIKDDVRMGHTLRGSFVITILTRLDEDEMVAPADVQASDVRDVNTTRTVDASPTQEISFNRRTMTTLATGLSTASKLLRSEAFDLDEAVQLGVSTQLVQSIAELSGFEGVRSVDTTFKWSPSHSAPGPGVPERVFLPNVTKEVSERVASRLKRRPAIPDETLIGKVVRLERGEATDGVVVVEGVVGKDSRKVKFELAPVAYAIATAAHDARSPIVAEGSITTESNGLWMRSPRRFEHVHANDANAGTETKDGRE
jgi:hypothetical protein